VIVALLALSTPSPSSTATPKLDADLVTPGLWGFVLLFFLAIAVYLLGRSMARRVRRVNQRARVEAELVEAELAEAEGRSPADGAVRDAPRTTPTAPTAADEDPPGSR